MRGCVIGAIVEDSLVGGAGVNVPGVEVSGEPEEWRMEELGGCVAVGRSRSRSKARASVPFEPFGIL